MCIKALNYITKLYYLAVKKEIVSFIYVYAEPKNYDFSQLQAPVTSYL